MKFLYSIVLLFVFFCASAQDTTLYNYRVNDNVRPVNGQVFRYSEIKGQFFPQSLYSKFAGSDEVVRDGEVANLFEIPVDSGSYMYTVYITYNCMSGADIPGFGATSNNIGYCVYTLNNVTLGNYETAVSAGQNITTFSQGPGTTSTIIAKIDGYYESPSASTLYIKATYSTLVDKAALQVSGLGTTMILTKI